jgi:hypothetical protein
MTSAPPGQQELYAEYGLDAIKECRRVLQAAQVASIKHLVTQMTVIPELVEPTSLGIKFYRACGQA